MLRGAHDPAVPPGRGPPAFLIPYLLNQRTAQAARRDANCSWMDLDLVIDSGDGSPVNPDTLSSSWPRFLKRSGLPHVRFQFSFDVVSEVDLHEAKNAFDQA